MIKYLKEILEEYKLKSAEKNLQKKIVALESAIEILENIKGGNKNANIK